MAIVSKKCNRCRKPMRNDGTEQNPKWVCNNPNCVKYVPPASEQEQTPEPENNGEDDSEDSAE